jgi:hypothetical protein
MFHQAVTAATLKALDDMPDANGRVERARDLVLTGAVTPQSDGTFIVKGLGGNGTDYITTQHTCTCPDQAKGFTCKHRIALWIWKTARTAVQDQIAALEPPAFLPEAPASCNVFVTVAGREEAKSIEATPVPAPEAVKEPEPLQQEAPLPAEPPAREDWCSIHQCTMPLRKNARGHWYSHRLPSGEYCKGDRN